ncbi:MAG: M23 family metallopeptidase, partial [Verrucomicrobia bacterium]|nr:M23 family metallopeptidase [Verrucomicrobiota bacterium]
MRKSAPAAAWLPVVFAILGPLALLFAAATWLSASTVESPSTTSVRLADAFDFPVGWPEATGYHKARGFRPNGHLGEDWDGDGGGNTDLGDPIYAAGNGLVLLARDVRMGWGNVVIVRHGFRDPELGGALTAVDTLYGHLDTVGVHEGQT